jgi:hypothetical protein
MKSESGSAPRVNKWRFSRTLRRKVEFRPIEDQDLKYLWAAYKQGAFEFEKRDMTAAEFQTEFLNTNCHEAWILFGHTRKGFIPVGIVFASRSPVGKFMTVLGAVWLPWASKRNIVECMVGFLRKVRWQYPLQFYVLPEHRRLYEICAMHGVVRRIGTSVIAIPGKQAAMFETRTPDKKAA